MYKRKVRILFLGYGNSCLSQMAEGYAGVLGKELLETQSAGLYALGKNFYAVEVMQEDGVDISLQESKLVTAAMLQWSDLVVIVNAEAENQCPLLPAHVQKKYWSFNEPSKTCDNNVDITAGLRVIRDEIRKRISSMLGGIKMLEKS